MRYCPSCGTPHDCTESGSEKTEVAIERLRTNRDIEVARINATAVTAVAETESEHSAEHAEGVAEGMETALDAVAGTDEAEDQAEGAPIIVSAPDTDTEPEGEPDTAPPVVDIPEPKTPSHSGWWDGYR